MAWMVLYRSANTNPKAPTTKHSISTSGSNFWVMDQKLFEAAVMPSGKVHLNIHIEYLKIDSFGK